MRISVVTAAEDRAWQSNRTITQGLFRAYRLLATEWGIIEHRVPLRTTPAETARMAHRVLEGEPEIVVFLDTWPFYGAFLAELSRRCHGQSPRSRPILRFHVYGDFTQLASQWLAWATHLNGFRVEWACASEPQCELLGRLIHAAPSSRWVCPFPVNTGVFHASEATAERASLRRALGVESHETLLLYAGRLSVQKNVLAAIKAFAGLSPSFLKKARFAFVGSFDDLPPPFWGAALRPGEFFLRWQHELAGLEPAVRERIQILPAVSGEALASLYRAADLFVSLSLVHDEDYGMAVAEAAASGLPLVLTEWGGYKGFRLLGLDGRWVSVRIEGGGATFSIAEASGAILEAAKGPRGSEARRQRAEVCASRLSLAAVSRLIRERSLKSAKLAATFNGMSDLMGQLAPNYDPASMSLRYVEWGKGTVYEEIYNCYV